MWRKGLPFYYNGTQKKQDIVPTIRRNHVMKNDRCTLMAAVTQVSARFDELSRLEADRVGG